MLAIILFGFFIISGYEALKHYDAEKYAKKRAYNQNISFIDFMFSNHPGVSIVTVILIIAIILAAVSSQG